MTIKITRPAKAIRDMVRRIKLMPLIYLILLSFCNPLAIPNGYCGTSTFHQVGKLTGQPSVLVIHGQELLAAIGSELTIFDIGQPDNPQKIGSVLLPASIKQMKVSGAIAYLLDEQNVLWSVDISNPSAPEILGNYANIPHTTSFTLVNDYAYLSWGYGIGIVDVHNPYEPQLIKVWRSDRKVSELFTYENFLFASAENQIIVLDASAAPMLSTVATIDMTEIAEKFGGISPDYSVFATGSVVLAQDNLLLLEVYIPSSNPGVLPTNFQVVCDVSDPYHPNVTKKVDVNLSVVDSGFGVGATPSCAPRLGCLGTDISVYSVDSQFNVQEILSSYYSGDIYSMALRSPFLYLTSSTGIFVTNINSPDFDAPSWSFPAETFWRISGTETDNLIMASNYGLRLADMSNLNKIKLSDSISLNITSSDYFTFSEPYLYLVKNSGQGQARFSVVDLSNPNFPNELGSLNIIGQVNDMAFYANKIFLAMGPGGIRIIDVSLPSMPRELPGLAPQNWAAMALTVENGLAFVASEANDVKIINISGYFPVEIGQINLSEPVLAVAAHNQLLYIGTDNSILRYDISEPLSPKHLSTSQLNTSAENLVAVDDILFMGSEGNIYIFSDSGLPSNENNEEKILPFAVVTGDFNLDGRADILRYDPNLQEARVFLSQENGFTKSDTLVINGLEAPDVCTVGDFNGDGYFDVLWHSPTNNTLNIYLSNGVNFVKSPTLIIGNLGPADAFAIGDFDNNGKDDVMWYEDWLGRATFFMSDGYFLSSRPETLDLPHPDALTAGNFDNQDGEDIMWYTYPTLTANFYLALGSIFYRWDQMAFKGFGMPYKYGVGDFNGDGLDDILWYESWNENVQIFASHSTYFAPEQTLALSQMPAPLFIACGDFDGNGKADLLWGLSLEGTAEAWLSDGTTFSRAPEYDVKLF